jgi:GT2 family glycosyltransferase
MNKVSIIIINYNTFALTSNCIRSVIDKTKGVGYEIILVDNASVECEASEFLKEFPSIKLARSTINGGFAHGNNLGIEMASGEYILLLNSDTILLEDSISKSVEFLAANKSIGVLGCRMTYADGVVQISARPFKTISWELLDLFRFIPYLMPYTKRSRMMLGKYFRHDANMECDWIGGAFFLVPKKIIDQLPGKRLDERFFMYGEDQLWCEQIRKIGYSIMFFSGTTIVHINRGSSDLTKQTKVWKTIMRHELEIIRLRKGHGLYYIVYKMIYVTKETVRNFIKSIVFFFTGKVIRK